MLVSLKLMDNRCSAQAIFHLGLWHIGLDMLVQVLPDLKSSGPFTDPESDGLDFSRACSERSAL